MKSILAKVGMKNLSSRLIFILNIYTLWPCYRGHCSYFDRNVSSFVHFDWTKDIP
jgi:hypothetical protein